MPNGRFNSALRAQLEELANLGSPVDLSVAGVKAERPELEIVQTGSVDFCSNILEMQGRGLGYIAEVAITNLTTRPVQPIEIELWAPWIDQPVQWLKAIPIRHCGRDAHKSSTSLVYRFPGNDMTFDYDEVLNDRLLEDTLPGKRSVQGLLLAFGGRMPAELHHGEWRELSLTLMTADHARYSTTLQLWTCRLEARTKIAKPRKSIFGSLGVEAGPRDAAPGTPQPGGPLGLELERRLPTGTDVGQVEHCSEEFEHRMKRAGNERCDSK